MKLWDSQCGYPTRCVACVQCTPYTTKSDSCAVREFSEPGLPELTFVTFEAETESVPVSFKILARYIISFLSGSSSTLFFICLGVPSWINSNLPPCKWLQRWNRAKIVPSEREERKAHKKMWKDYHDYTGPSRHLGKCKNRASPRSSLSPFFPPLGWGGIS